MKSLLIPPDPHIECTSDGLGKKNKVQSNLDFNIQAIYNIQSLDLQKNNSTNHLNLTFCLLVFYLYTVLNYLIFHSLYIVHIDFSFFFLFVYTLSGQRVSVGNKNESMCQWKRSKLLNNFCTSNHWNVLTFKNKLLPSTLSMTVLYYLLCIRTRGLLNQSSIKFNQTLCDHHFLLPVMIHFQNEVKRAINLNNAEGKCLNWLCLQS